VSHVEDGAKSRTTSVVGYGDASTFGPRKSAAILDGSSAVNSARFGRTAHATEVPPAMPASNVIHMTKTMTNAGSAVAAGVVSGARRG
jgi:hypothetical protein